MKHLPRSQKSVSLHCVFHSIRFKVNKGWSKALLLFYAPTFLYFTSEIYYCHSSTVIDYFFGFPQI